MIASGVDIHVLIMKIHKTIIKNVNISNVPSPLVYPFLFTQSHML